MLDIKRTIIALALIAAIVCIILFGKETMPQALAAAAGAVVAAALSMLQTIWKLVPAADDAKGDNK